MAEFTCNSEAEFIAAILTRGVACTIEDVRTIQEYQGLSAFPSLSRLISFCDRHSVLVTPKLDEGEMGDERTFTRGVSINEYQAAFSEALARGECGSVEFKQTFFLNVRRLENDPQFNPTSAVDETMIHEIGKTITAFMNAGGGTLLIGVQDDGDLYGIENEFPYIPGAKKDIDGWELLLWAKLEATIESFGRIRGGISGSTLTHEGHSIFVIIVKPVSSLICICRDLSSKIESVYVRNGNNSNKLRLREIEDLVLLRAGVVA